jgi:hypothetical protein
MSGKSCSGQNGACEVCGEGLTIALLQADTYDSIFGYTCLNGNFNGNYYWSRTQSSTSSSEKNETAVGSTPYEDSISFTSNGGGSCSYSSQEWIESKVDDYGNILYDNGYFYLLSGGGNFNGIYDDNFRDIMCEPDCSCDDIEEGGGGACGSRKAPFGPSSSSGDCSTIYCGPGVGLWSGCRSRRIGLSSYSCNSTSTNEVSCTRAQGSSSFSDSFSSGLMSFCGVYYAQTRDCQISTDPNDNCWRGVPYNGKSSDTSQSSTNLSSKQNISSFHGRCVQSVIKKINIYEKNLPQNKKGDKCGDGNIDDCWGFDSSFFSPDKGDSNSTSTGAAKVKIKIAIDKEILTKKYSSIGGKVYLYTGGDGGTPCCTECGGTECFTGKIISQYSYNLSSGSKQFKSTLLATDVGEYTSGGNADADGKMVGICYTIDNVTYI